MSNCYARAAVVRCIGIGEVSRAVFVSLENIEHFCSNK